ncbi:hypothetical protein [Flavobacterium sp. N1736]|nr:hypothetical protein [Flavobacterium sp. N1736]
MKKFLILILICSVQSIFSQTTKEGGKTKVDETLNAGEITVS